MKSENKWSVIVPTIWKSEYIFQQLSRLIDSPNIQDIVLIDNSNKFLTLYKTLDKKITLIIPPSNLFPYPSWNLGVQKAQSNNIILANDDIIWDPKLLTYLDLNQFSRFDVLGQATENYIRGELTTTRTSYTFDYEPIRERPDKWGTLLFTQKHLLKPFPETLKIWYGDDWLIKKADLKVGKIKDFPYGGSMSVSQLPQFSNIRSADFVEYNKL